MNKRRKQKIRKYDTQNTLAGESVFASPFDEAFASPFDTEQDKQDCLNITYSMQHPEELKEKIDDVLSLRDRVLMSTTLRGCNWAYVPDDEADEYKTTRVDLKDASGLRDSATDLNHDLYGSFDGHIGRSACFNGPFHGKLVGGLVSLRVNYPKYEVFEDCKQVDFRTFKPDEIDVANTLYRTAYEMSKCYALALISTQIRDYIRLHGEENSKIRSRIKDGHYQIVMTHYETGESVVPFDSEEIMIELPDPLYAKLAKKKANSHNIYANCLDLSCYDGYFEKLFKNYDKYQADINDVINTRIIKKEKHHSGILSVGNLSDRRAKGIINTVCGCGLIAFQCLLPLLLGPLGLAEAGEMANLIQFMLTCTSTIGVAMLILGVYNLVFSFAFDL